MYKWLGHWYLNGTNTHVWFFHLLVPYLEARLQVATVVESITNISFTSIYSFFKNVSAPFSIDVSLGANMYDTWRWASYTVSPGQQMGSPLVQGQAQLGGGSIKITGPTVSGKYLLDLIISLL